jgi:hypothetical protein
VLHIIVVLPLHNYYRIFVGFLRVSYSQFALPLRVHPTTVLPKIAGIKNVEQMIRVIHDTRYGEDGDTGKNLGMEYVVREKVQNREFLRFIAQVTSERGLQDFKIDIVFPLYAFIQLLIFTIIYS